MDVYEATRKKRSTHPTLAPLPEQHIVQQAKPPQLSTLPKPSSAPLSQSQSLSQTHSKLAGVAGGGSLSLGAKSGIAHKHRLLRSVSGTFRRTESADESEVETPPTRAHWRSDNEVSTCAACFKTFSLFGRRHHCRRCGNIFCKACSAGTARLDSSASFSDHGHLVRVCDACLKEGLLTRADQTKNEVERLRQQKAMLERERERKRQRDTERHNGQPPTSSSPAQSINIKQPEASSSPQPESMGVGTLGSVPSDWNWSTF